MSVMVVAVVCVPRSCRSSRRTGYRAQTSPHCRADTSAMTPTCNRADDRPGAGSE